MKATGIIKEIDELGRVVIPKEIRMKYGIDRAAVEIFTDDDCIILKKQENTCVFCGVKENLTDFEGKFICETCLNNIKNI